MTRAEIRELACPRRLVTRELSPFNAFYGHADILRRYAGISGSRPIKAAIEHGVSFAPNPHDPDLATHLPRYFCGGSAQARWFEEHASHGTSAVPIGSPIYYARALAGEPSAPRDRLVFFDAHSSHFATARYDVAAAARRLVPFRDDFAEVVVCLYWRDVVLGRAELYAEQGFETVTAGHMFDPSFLFRFVEIVSAASVVLTDNVGSHLLYALALDRPVWLEHVPVDYDLAAGAPAGTLGPSFAGDVVLPVQSLFGRRVEWIEPGQRAFAEELLGAAQVHAPGELAARIAEAEEAYRSETPAHRRVQLEARAAARRLWNGRRW